MMDIVKAAKATRKRVPKSVKAKRCPKGNGPEHAVWMLDGIIAGYIQHEKAHRWLGYAQGMLVSFLLLSLDEAKAVNNM